MFQKQTTRLLIGVLACIQTAHGHGLWQPEPGASVQAQLTTSYRNRGSADNALWQVPGTLMGGESAGTEQGLALDELAVSLSLAGLESTYGILELSHHEGHSELEIEQAFAGFIHMRGPWQLRLEAGNFSSLFSPQHARHANEDHFIDTPLPYAVLYGEHFQDTGARVLLSHPEGRGLGLEAFEGNAFPAARNGTRAEPGAASTFAYYHFVFDRMLLQTRIWYNWFRADARQDDRLEHDDAHVHAPQTNTPAPYWFDGDTHILGLRAKVIWLGWQWAQLSITAELFDADISGTVRDAQRQAELNSALHAGWAKFAIQKDAHTLALSYAQLMTDNVLKGDAGPALAELTGLMDIERNPSRWRASYSHRLEEGLTWSLEAHHDQTQRKAFHALIAAIRWQGNW